MIDNREELIDALTEASEIEHGLMVQYLYAAFTMKRELGEGLTTRQQMMNRQWLANILTVARQEMGHLGIVCNLLTAVGGGPRLGRPNMPRKTGYYPFPFDLLPLNDTTLYRFMVFELPQGMSLPPPPGADLRAPAPPELDEMLRPAPDELKYQYVGELYAKIAEGFRAIQERDLFIGPPSAQVSLGRPDGAWSVVVKPVTGRDTALAAIERIIEQGEGTPQDRENSHYDRFKDTRLAYFDAGRYAAARAVPVNPATREHRDADGPVVLIRNTASRDAVETFNVAYGVVLLMLQHFFSLAPGAGSAGQIEAKQRTVLRLSFEQAMTVAIRPLAEIVSILPLDDPQAPERAGPSFELYSDVTLSPFPEARWPILLERLDGVIAACAALGLPRAALVAETLGYLRRPLANAALGRF